MPSINGPVNQTRLIELVAEQLDWSEEDARKAVHATLDVIAATLAKGHNVMLTNFGTFVSYRASARKVRNPQTGETWRANEHQRARFRPSKRLAQVVRRRGGSIRKHPKSQPEVQR